MKIDLKDLGITSEQIVQNVVAAIIKDMHYDTFQALHNAEDFSLPEHLTRRVRECVDAVVKQQVDEALAGLRVEIQHRVKVISKVERGELS
jgi:hypothetical protein